jgi:hypothetical protein
MCKIPFGIELYNKKSIINIEVELNNNNTRYNEIVKLNQLENYIRESKYRSYNFKKTIENKELYSNIKKIDKNNDKVFLRCHIKKDIKILNNCLKKSSICEEMKTTNNINSYKIVEDKTYRVILEIGNIWITGDKYGILLYILEIESID